MAEYDVFMTDKEGNKYPIFTIGQDEMDRLNSVPDFADRFKHFAKNKKLGRVRHKSPERTFMHFNYEDIARYLKANGPTSARELYRLGALKSSVRQMCVVSKFTEDIGEYRNHIYILTPEGEEYLRMKDAGFSCMSLYHLVLAIREGRFRVTKDGLDNLHRNTVCRLCRELRNLIDNGKVNDIGYVIENTYKEHRRMRFYPLEKPQFEECAEVVC